MQLPEPSAIATLGWLARAEAIASKSFADEARRWLADNHAPVQAQRIFDGRIHAKAAVGAGSTTDSTLGQFGISIGAWSDAARTRSAFYRIWADGGFTKVPMETRVGMVTSSPTGAVVAEGKAVPVGKVTLNNVALTPIKVGALIVVTDNLLLDIGVGQSVFNRELLGAISDAVDTAFVDKLDNGLTPIASSTPMDDLRSALLQVSIGAGSRLYWIAATDVAIFGATLGSTKGGQPVSAASATGGELGNIPLLVAHGVPSGTLYLVDAAAIAVDAVAPSVDVSSQADILMDTAPGMASDVPTPAQMVSMFQTNSVALKATAIFGCEKSRSNAVAVVTGITSAKWGAS
jgi:hypothetical protein